MVGNRSSGRFGGCIPWQPFGIGNGGSTPSAGSSHDVTDESITSNTSATVRSTARRGGAVRNAATADAAATTTSEPRTRTALRDGGRDENKYMQLLDGAGNDGARDVRQAAGHDGRAWPERVLTEDHDSGCGRRRGRRDVASRVAVPTLIRALHGSPRCARSPLDRLAAPLHLGRVEPELSRRLADAEAEDDMVLEHHALPVAELARDQLADMIDVDHARVLVTVGKRSLVEDRHDPCATQFALLQRASAVPYGRRDICRQVRYRSKSRQAGEQQAKQNILSNLVAQASGRRPRRLVVYEREQRLDPGLGARVRTGRRRGEERRGEERRGEENTRDDTHRVPS
jgi:hypothetical protein